MRRRRSSEPMGDTSSNLGTAMDELMRHQPSLREAATTAIINLLKELCSLGSDPNCICSKPAAKSGDGSQGNSDRLRPVIPVNTPADGSSDEDEEEDEENTTTASGSGKQVDQISSAQPADTKQPVPLVDYILHVSLAHEREVLKESLKNLHSVLESLQELCRPLDPPGGSVLLEELLQGTVKALTSGTDPLQSSTLTPLLHGMSAAHAYISMFAHVCRTGQLELRNLLVTHWGSETGLIVLKGLSRLYTSLVWESTVLLALCSESSANAPWQFGRHQLEKLSGLTKESDVNSQSVNEEQTATSSAKMEVDDNTDAGETETLKKKAFQNKLSQQMKQIKPLLSSASRLGRALADLFGLLVKLSVGSPIRHRRSHHTVPNAPIAPSPPARSVASALTKLLATGLSWTPPPTSPIPKFRYNQKYPYHLMLQKFVHCGGQDAFFQTFKWALSQEGKIPLEEGIEHPELPDGTGEFLDSWLMLLEKMANPKMVLESPHTMPLKASQPNFVAFDPVKYLIQTHKKAFECVMHIWNKKPLKVYGERMSESVLAILCHLLRGETIINEKLAKDKETEVQGSSASSSTTRSSRRNELEEQGISTEHLQQLIDMGFARELALEALVHSSSLEQATEYLLSHPTINRTPNAADWDMSEDDQMMRAIAMSLGENVTEEDSEQDVTIVKDDEPLSKQRMDDFTNDILSGCLNLLDTLPDTVYRVCDMLLAVCQRNGEKWSENMIKQLLAEISENINKLLESTKPMTSGDKRTLAEWASQVTQLPEALKAATRIHLFTLMFEEKRNECAFLIQESTLLDSLIQLLEAAQNALSLTSSNKMNIVSTPKWLAPVILLIDLYEKSSVASNRRAPLLALQRRQWKWFDDRSGKWSSYALNNNKTIDDAYKAGDSYVRFSATRRKYVVQFSTMVQINEESGNWRPIMFVNDDKAMDITEEGSSSSVTVCQSPNYRVIKGMEPQYCVTLIRTAVGFMSIPVDPDTLHAVMRLCLRLTRNYEYSSQFAELGGIRALLQLSQLSAFTGFTSLATLLIRHVLEEPTTLRQTMEKVIRSTTHHSPMSCKEMHYILRVLGPAACRENELFLEISKSILRVSLMPLTKREEDDTRLLAANAVQMLKLLPTKQTNVNVQPTSIVRDVISDLLNTLTVKVNTYSEELKDNLSVAIDSQNVNRLNRESSSSDLVQQDDIDESASVDEQPVPVNSTDSNKVTANAKDDESAKKNRLLLSQSSILRLLAELVRSYCVVAKLITEHTYQPSQTEFINEECTALSFILDQLLPSTQTVGDKDCPALTRVLIAALSSCNHCPEAQTTLVNEVKSALHRALSLNESSEKHAKVQALMSIISTMIDSCPSINQSSQLNLPSSVRNQSNGLNVMVKIMLRRGIVTDLARTTHSLDLSSPHMATTVNSVLKPLETLSRIINLPNTPVAIHPKKTKTGHQSSTSNTEAMEEDNAPSAPVTSNGVPNSAAQTTDSSRVTGPDSGYDLTDTGEVNTETSTSETNAFADVTVDENTDNEGVVIEEGVPFDLYNDGHPRPNSLIDDLRNEHDIHNDDNEEAVDESHDNVVNSNGAESESGEESDSDEDDDDASGADEEERDEDDDEDDDEEDDDDDDERVDDDDDDDDEVEDDEAAGYVDHDEIEDAVTQLSDVFGIEDMLPTSVFQEGSFRLSSLLPMLETEPHANTGDVSQPSVPPAPGNVTASHPLLVRHGDIGATLGLAQTSASTAANILASRSHRSGRQRIYRPNVNSNSVNSHHNWHMQMNSRHPNPPVILQRLLGPSTAQDFLQMTSGASTSQPTRLIFTSNDFQFIATDEDWLDLHDSGNPGGTGSSSALGCIPSAMLRWTEESRVLDGDSMHDCVASLKPEIIEIWEKYRDEEIADRKEKRKKLIEEDEKAKKENKDNKKEPVKDGASDEKIANESSLNANTERLAESIVEQVLGPALASSAVASNDGASQVSMEVNENQATMNSVHSNEAVLQNDNEITEMMCAETTTEPEKPVAMDVNGSSNTNANGEPSSNELPVSGDSPPLPPERLLSNEGASLPPSSLLLSSDEFIGTTDRSESEERRDNIVSTAPEPNNVVEVANDLSTNAEAATRSVDPATGEMEIPEGVDPSFLAALPENIRQEVIAEQLRLQRIQQQRNNAASNATQPSSSNAASTANIFNEVNPEFLAALPPNIQEEVLAQQRAEQQRLQAENSNPDTPVDPASFISTLPPGLRRQVLADMDDSLLALLPGDLAAEAQSLRLELETRHRQMQERFFSNHATTALSRILRTAIDASLAAGRMSHTRYTIHTVQPTTWPWNIGSRGNNSFSASTSSTTMKPSIQGKIRGRQLLDNEALSCLLILLFVDEPKLNVQRLHRVLRNLCHHTATRQWIIQSLLAIMERIKDTKESSRHSTGHQMASWLSISLDAALGCRTNVFQIHRNSGSKKSNIPAACAHNITIHPQAGALVCRHVLDTLIALAKSFPHHFLPEQLRDDQKASSKDELSSSQPVSKLCKDTDFWEVLVKLDSLSTNRKGKSVIKSHTSFATLGNSSQNIESESISADGGLSPLAAVISLLSHPVIKRSSLLTDKLLHLLSHAAFSLPTMSSAQQAQTSTNQNLSATKSTTTGALDAREGLMVKPIVGEEHLKLAVDVLTSKSCSEDGLEDATQLLLRLSRHCEVTRNVVFRLLLDGARQLGFTVCQHIRRLSEELKNLNLSDKETNEDGDEKNTEKAMKGTLYDRFTQGAVVISAPSHFKHSISSKEVQLPSMASLTSKTSSQSFFLRILKVIVPLRKSIKGSKSKTRNQSQATQQDSSTLMNQESMEIDVNDQNPQEPLSFQLELDELWDALSNCLIELADAPDHHAVLVLQPAVEAFFLVHASDKEKSSRDMRHENRETNVNNDLAPGSPASVQCSSDSQGNVCNQSPETQKFVQFAETHKVVLNQILRQSTTPLTDGPFSVLVDHTRVLDFDVKRRYFRQELESLDDDTRREDLAVHVRREHVFEDSFRELYRRPSEEWKNRFYIVFEGEEGQDAGGLLREWYTIISREIFNPMYALFTTSPGDRVTYMINSASHCNSNHLQYFKFVGRVIAKAIYDNKLLEAYFTRSFYKHILGKPVKYTDMESEDYSFYQGLVFLLDHDVKELGYELTFSVEVQEFGVTE
ncbi:E3 ubiquitin-protein ligase HUWE1-like protein, partial [Leptotrombidium deliense]